MKVKWFLYITNGRRNKRKSNLNNLTRVQKVQITKKLMRIIIGVFLYFFILSSCDNLKSTEKEKTDDDYYEKCRKLVLSENKVGQEYIFKINGKSIDEINIIYLGNIKTNSGRVLKFIRTVNYMGLYEDSRRANGQVFIYDKENKRLGFYYVGGSLDVPSKIAGSDLIFSYNNEQCNQTTSISFIDSIPKQIFLACTEEGGNLYTFEK
jgi:hypothetical protein